MINDKTMLSPKLSLPLLDLIPYHDYSGDV